MTNMPFTQSMCDSYLLECLVGNIHVPATDVFKLALYTAAAVGVINYTATAYTATNEVPNGNGYATGGVALAVSAGYPKLIGRSAVLAFGNAIWNPASFAARLGLIYNSSKANRAVAVIDFLQTLNPATQFQVQWPTPSETASFMRLRAAQ